VAVGDKVLRLRLEALPVVTPKQHHTQAKKARGVREEIDAGIVRKRVARLALLCHCSAR